MKPEKQPRYQPVTNFSYWPVPGSFNNWNIVILSHKSTTSDAFEEIHKVVLDGISDIMALLLQPGKYDSMNTTYTPTIGYYVIKFVSEAYNLQEETACNGQIISAGGLVSKAQYLRFMQEKSIGIVSRKISNN